MTGRPGHWSEPGEYNILFLRSILVISSQSSSALGYRELTQEGAMRISPFAAREGTSAPQWPIVKKCCRHLVPSSDFFVQSYAVPIFRPKFRCDTSRHRGGRCDTKIFRGCSATLVLHLRNAIKSRKSAATRVARHV